MKGCLVYNGILYFEEWEEQTTLLKEVLKRLVDEKFAVNPNKNYFGRGNLEYLGCQVKYGTEGIACKCKVGGHCKLSFAKKHKEILRFEVIFKDIFKIPEILQDCGERGVSYRIYA